MTLWAWFAVALLSYEGAALLTGDRWPPTVTEVVRKLRGPTQVAAAVAILLVPFLHLVEVIR